MNDINEIIELYLPNLTNYNKELLLKQKTKSSSLLLYKLITHIRICQNKNLNKEQNELSEVVIALITKTNIPFYRIDEKTGLNAYQLTKFLNLEQIEKAFITRIDRDSKEKLQEVKSEFVKKYNNRTIIHKKRRRR